MPLKVGALLLVCVASRAGVQAARLEIDIDSRCAYRILVNGDVWFDGGAAAVVSGGALYASDGTLQLVQKTGTTCDWALWGDDQVLLRTEISSDGDAAVFRQSFPRGLGNPRPAEEAGGAVSGFPALRTSRRRLDALSYAGCQLQDSTRLAWPPAADAPPPGASDHKGSGDAPPEGFPFVAYDGNLTTLVTSPLDNFFLATQRGKVAGRAFGLHGGLLDTFEEVPPGHSHETVLVAGRGVAATVARWGEIMRQRAPPKVAPKVARTHLSYYTDNGAYYYYNTAPGETYEATMRDVRSGLDRDGVPAGAFQYDSWWYLKAADGGVDLWEPTPDTFPSGLDPAAGAASPLVLHNRWFSPATQYLAEYPDDQWSLNATGDTVVVPLDPRFFARIMAKARRWGLETYEQDFLTHAYSANYRLRSEAGVAERWLDAMAAGARANGATVQYCMALPRHVLQSTRYAEVTHARASADYGPGRDQWSLLGLTALLYRALGLAPFKDVFWSASLQPRPAGKRNYTFEPNPELEAVAATLSAGPVAAGDGLGFWNATRLARTCRKDGLLLQPDAPAALDDQAFAKAFGGNGSLPILWSAEAAVAGAAWRYVFAADLAEPFEYELPPGDWVARDAYGGDARRATKLRLATDVAHGASPVPPGESSWPGARPVPFGLWTLAPVVRGWALLGEAAKVTAVCARRFASFEASNDVLRVGVLGAADETVVVDVWRDGATTATACRFEAAGTLSLVCDAASCACD